MKLKKTRPLGKKNFFEENKQTSPKDLGKEVLLVGNPNSGKTTLFNALTASNEHVGNWHGVTVDTVGKGFSFQGEDYFLVDTPGIYSLCPLSYEEKVAVDKIEGSSTCKIINICDQNNLQRNLYLTLCLLERGLDVVLAVNEIDKKPIFKVDCKKLGERLGINVVRINAEKKIGLDDLKSCLKEEKRQKKDLPYLKQLKLVEAEKNFQAQPNSVQQISQLRYAFIDEILKDCAVRTKDVYGKSKLDKIFLNKWLAFPIFICILAAIFQLTFFSLGSLLSDALGQILSFFTTPILNFIRSSLGEGFVYSLFADAIFGGVGTVLSFLPQVVLLFFFLSILEDSGYMSRIAFIFEDILGRIGLSGKSVYTLLMGFGCSTTAIMTSRNMEDKNAKIKTAILCPYMSCSAKIPIYTVVGGAFFGAKNIFVIMGLYALGVIVAILVSKILDMTLLKSKAQSFILEFPPYRKTSLKRVGKILWKNVKEFLLRVGSVMISMNIIIWLLSSFSFSFQYVPSSGGVSALESFGRILAPIFSPLGFGSWAVVASLLAGLVAKEVVVSSIAMFNGIDQNAIKLLSASLLLPGSVVFFSSRAAVVAFLVFCLLYTPCIASISMLLQEVGKKWTIISIFIQFGSAYILAFLTYQILFAAEIFGFFSVFAAIFSIFAIIFAIFYILRRIKKKKLCPHCEQCNKKCKNS